MNFYYGQEAIPGSCGEERKVSRGTAIPAYIPSGKAVLRVDPTGHFTRYPSVQAAASAAGVKQPTMSAWIRDGGEHRGFVWRFEADKR